MSISKKRLEKIEAIKEEDIDLTDIPELDNKFWERAEMIMPQAKQGVYIRLDSDMLGWFKDQGKGYQTRINNILRAYYETQENHVR